MSDFTKIEWCDATLNLWWGCTKVSAGCWNCYAETLADGRFGRSNWGPTGTRQEVKSWQSTLNKISRRAKAEGRPLKVFCQSMSDTFEGPETCGGATSDNWRLMSRLREELGAAADAHPELTFLLLTKRPKNVLKYGPLGYRWSRDPMPRNLWIGTSVEDQVTADTRIPTLLRIPATIRFLRCEPLLGPVNLERVSPDSVGRAINSLTGSIHPICSMRYRHSVDWVICGGESFVIERQTTLEWAESLKKQCKEAKVPFFMNPRSADKGFECLQTREFPSRSNK